MNQEELINNLKNNNITIDKKRQMIEDFFSTDENEKYTFLKFVDYNGKEYNLIGKKPLDLSLDEIVAVKQYANYLYESVDKTN